MMAVPKVSPNRYQLPFDWEKHFVWSRDATKCLGACALMAIKYWGIELPESECQRILSEINVPAFQGANPSQVFSVVKQVVGATAEEEESARDTRLRFYYDRFNN